MLFACILLAAGGIACNVAGALLDYGPLYTAGGISIGFAVGCYLTRRAALEAVREVRRGRAVADKVTRMIEDHPPDDEYRATL
jgi:uncharacterized membrane protein YdjX (TVP38/TMEM64 family)